MGEEKGDDDDEKAVGSNTSSASTNVITASQDASTVAAQTTTKEAAAAAAAAAAAEKTSAEEASSTSEEETKVKDATPPPPDEKKTVSKKKKKKVVMNKATSTTSSTASSTRNNTPPRTFSEHLHQTWIRPICAAAHVTLEQRMTRAQQLQPYLGMTDAYITLQGGPTTGHLPALDWNTSFRKAYALLLWVRPRLQALQQPETKSSKDSVEEKGKEKDSSENNASESSETSENEAGTATPRVLYRFSTSSDDAKAVGVCVTCSEWRVAVDGKTIQSTLTAYSLPSMKPASLLEHSRTAGTGRGGGMDTYSSYVQVPLTLKVDEWQLIGITHTFPYLKRPVWSVAVDGHLCGQGELHYPICDPGVSMDDNAILQNLVVGGARQEQAHDKRDDQKTASQLAAERASSDTNSTANNDVDPSTLLNLELDIASLAFYSDAVSTSIQAVVAEAGPNMSLQKCGRILPTLPPVPNWTKGSSMEGPKVGIPLTVHSAALELQKLSGQFNFGISALSARVLGRVGPSQRLVCPLEMVPGATEQTPRVGLIRPSPPVRLTEDEVPVLYLAGHTTLFHAMSEYLLLQNAAPDSNSSSTETSSDGHGSASSSSSMLQLESTTRNLSVALQEQMLVPTLVLPFFLALCPPAKVFDLQLDLYVKSIQQLYALYSDGGAYAAQLITMLADAIRRGGARIAEEVLQGGILHILASCLRLGLLRCQKVKFFSKSAASVEALRQRFVPLTEEVFAQNRQEGTSPSYVPPKIAQACVDLMDACCGPAEERGMDLLSPALQIKRASDCALTALFGLALDFDLWGCDVAAASTIMKCVADRYGGVSVTAGYILRSQISVQYFLDNLRLRFDPPGIQRLENASSSSKSSPPSSSSSAAALEATAHHLSMLLQSMLLSSLSNRRSISQGEHDISACMGALSDSPLGSVGAHVVLNALVGVLAWCEVLPVEVSHAVSEPGNDDEHKMQVASRLGRNLLMSQFHDVVAPMILSRTVFSGDRTVPSSTSTNNQSTPSTSGAPAPYAYEGSLSWQGHWQHSLLLFSWVSSIAGAEGLIAAQSSGSLLLAAGLAGSLNGALEGADKILMTALFLPPPAIALMIGSTIRDEWSYTDLLADRLQIMMPLVPGMVVSLLSQPSAGPAPPPPPPPILPGTSLATLAELLTAVGGAFHRVFGGTIHSTGGGSPSKRRDGFSECIKPAKTHSPHLLIVVMLFERTITSMNTATENATEEGKDEERQSEASLPVTILRPQTSNDSIRRIDMESWVDVSKESVISESPFPRLSSAGEVDSDGSSMRRAEDIARALRSCQDSVLNTVAGLMTNAMNAGGGGASASLWQTVMSTLRESTSYSSYTVSGMDRVLRDGEASSEAEENDNNKETEEEATANMNPVASNDGRSIVAHSVLCRLIALVLVKALKRDYQWEVWSHELSSAVSGLIILVEEKGLLRVPSGSAYSQDQIVLICALLDVLEYGRDATGWCQLALPVMGGANDSFPKSGHDLSASSKLLLPVLQPCLRVLMECISQIPTATMVSVPRTTPEPSASSPSSDEAVAPPIADDEALLGRAFSELDFTLTAAIVGLAFPHARDVALNAVFTLRNAMEVHRQAGDEAGAQLCIALLCKVTGELRERYKAEKRLRENALYDAYEDGGANGTKQAEESKAVERFLTGADLTGLEYGSEVPDTDSSSRAAHRSSETEQVDFVLFPSSSSDGEKTKLSYAQYEGLGSALEKCSVSPSQGDSISAETIVSNIVAELAPYLDAWKEAETGDAADTELVSLFDSTLSIEDEADMPGDTTQVIRGSETAADAMSTYFEFAAAEKSRLKELALRFLPSSRYSRISFAHRFCWARFADLGLGNLDDMWERTIPDGNRDVRSRLATVPCSPQFPRYIPKYLDHGPDTGESQSEKSPTSGLASPAELDAFTKTLLEAGNLEIVDITKKKIEEDDDEPDVTLGPMGGSSMDEGEEFVEANIEGTQNREDIQHEQETNTEKADDAVSLDDSASKGDESTGHGDTASKVSHHSITSSAFATPPDNASSSLSLMHSAAAGMIEMHIDNCLQVKAEGSRQCTLLLTGSHLILEFDGDAEGYYEGELLAVQEEAERQRMVADLKSHSKDAADDEVVYKRTEKRNREVAALRPKSIRWNLTEISHAYLRRYRLRDSSIELFFIPSGGTSFGGAGLFDPSSSVFLDFGPGYEGTRRRDEAAHEIMKRSPPQAIKQWPDRSQQFIHEQLSRLTLGWVEGRLTNFDYLLHLNVLSGRSYNDICQYPVFPWVLADYSSETIPDLTDKKNFRDLSKPVGALNPDRLNDFIERFNTFADPSIPPFMYGSHYSTSAGVVLHFLVRLHPFAGLHRQLQSGHFDVADRLFSSVPRTWSMCTGQSAAEVKELTPEWYCNPRFLENVNGFKLGTSQDGETMGDVELPPWAEGSPDKFIDVMRAALESDVCSEMLPDWIDLIFGRKQQGPEAINANNVFFYLTYYGSVDVASIEDESLRQATELQIAHFGQCPMQLFKRPHVRRLVSRHHRLGFLQLLSSYSQRSPKDEGEEAAKTDDAAEDQVESSKPSPRTSRIFGEPLFLPFYSAPLSHWVHLDAPPPGPHSALIAVRLAGSDRCLAVDGKGVFHTFRWAWRADAPPSDNPFGGEQFDPGCFIAQRELHRFRSVPRLMYVPDGDTLDPPVAISKTLFAGRSVLLVLSAGDSRGSLAMQLVDPAKGQVRGEVMIPFVHSARIRCIATDPIGTAAGHGGVGGELAVVGSADGNASLWRFMSSHYLPLRPRARLSGHEGSPIYAVAICSSINIAATLSSNRCCLHTLGNGAMIRSFAPPNDALDFPDSDSVETTSRFAESAAMAVSVNGFVVAVCETTVRDADNGTERVVVTLNLFSLDGVSLGSKPVESWRGLPHKMHCTPDGTALFVCTGRGVTIHRLSAAQPLEFLDEWQTTEVDDLTSNGSSGGSSLPGCHDLDLGPSLHRPVCAAAACSDGILRLHALPGISAWSERNKKGGLKETVGTALARPAQRINRVVRDGFGIGSRLADMGRDIGKEVKQDVTEKGVGGFLGSIFRKNTPG